MMILVSFFSIKVLTFDLCFCLRKKKEKCHIGLWIMASLGLDNWANIGSLIDIIAILTFFTNICNWVN